ncbi:carboxypeptidase-like regulatory domain-containing protein [Longimicrobium sp.]|uniref:carboxypeptidase-like regulatory domain-containing protein n=1 Tax=Longimicrobium sp. TaxID=2029185 RepID=UPI002E35DB95|nr:carboxypeptidase-like regulatory domain-containing protein [Longimicrobium sp.]HEX6038171.1 carboxypeptidase-like regulatory domain-containing protein [Longimicrobium sp.]
MKRQTVVTGVLALGMLLGSGSCILACGCGRPPASVVHGTVRAENGQGVAGAALELRNTAPNGWHQTVVSAADGVYRFPEVQGQVDYALTVQPPAGWTLAPGQAASTQFFMTPEDTLRVDFVLRAP